MDRKRSLSTIMTVVILVALIGITIWVIHGFFSGEGDLIPRGGEERSGPSVAADTSHLPVVYSTDFSKSSGGGWSDAALDRTPKDHLPFLGQFGNENVTLRIEKLPPHQFVRLKFELYIINTWDGIAIANGGGRIGPDYWSLDVHGGPNLIRGTFSNTTDDPGFAPDGRLQTYPYPIPSGSVHAKTGASGDDSLGYIFTFKNVHLSFAMDSVYPIEVTIPHTGDAVQFDFKGSELQELEDESWGLANVRVEALPADAVAFNAAQFGQLFDAVMGNDAVAANAAFWKLVAGGDQTVKLLDENVKSLGVDFSAARTAIDGLGSKDAGERMRSLAALKRMGPAIEPLLEAYRKKVAGAAGDVDAVLEAIVVRPLRSPERRRGAAAARLLQVIDTEASGKLLERLYAVPASGKPNEDDRDLAFATSHSLGKGESLK